jgi:uncharacterized protein YdeI (YjbR/CyaY-like superfamily)
MTVTTRAPEVDAVNLLALAIPAELGVLLDRSSRARARFWRLDNGERFAFVRFVDEAKTPSSRQWRATIAVTRLSVAAARPRPDARSWQF